MPDGPPITTHTSLLLPVLQDGVPAMLKLTRDAEEVHGGRLMEWWDGDGAARVLARAEGALLMERAPGSRSLLPLAVDGGDEEATRIICAVAARLHAPRGAPPAGLVPLAEWFAPLFPTARTRGGFFAHAAAAAEAVLASEREITALHGDLHHDNILDFGPRGWLAIDPKRLVGERSFEYAILFCDPDLGDPAIHLARRPEIFARRLAIVSEVAWIERRRLLKWILAWCGLSSAWAIGDGERAPIELAVGEMAIAALEEPSGDRA